MAAWEEAFSSLRKPQNQSAEMRLRSSLAFGEKNIFLSLRFFAPRMAMEPVSDRFFASPQNLTARMSANEHE